VAVITACTMNIDNITVIPLFPTPVFSYEIEMEETDRSFLLNQYPDNVIKNTGNLTSIDHNILKNKKVKLLEKKLLLCVNDAFDRIHTPRLKCKLYITQSWLNFTCKDQYHHQHSHPNSFLSAVLYLKAAEEDFIVFHHPSLDHNYEIYSNQYNMFNSISWQIPVKENILLIFPSTLPHSVPTVNHDNLRVSLSFNTFLKGEIGSPTNLNHLVLKS
jgi:uncharacterized protein (TIGR02466 family)